MNWKAPEKTYNTKWHKKFVVWVRRTEDGRRVLFGSVWRKWLTHMNSGRYLYRVDKP